MIISKAIFSGSSQHIGQKPSRKAPEFAFIGRSNVGKSSLINMLSNYSNLAKTSSTPGKTRLINHFLINGEWYLVDLPGYGYAKMSKTGISALNTTVQNYIQKSEEMVLLFVLLDSRHDIQKIDLDFMIRLGENGIPFAIIFTKCDKLGTNLLKRQIERNKKTLLDYWEELPPVFLSSSATKFGREEILTYIESTLKSI